MSCVLVACADNDAQVEGSASVESAASTDSRPAEDGVETDEESTDGESTEDEGHGSVEDEPETRSPIQIFFDQTPYNDERHRETEELIFVCMKRQGFDYVITEFDAGTSDPAGLLDPSLAFGSVEFAERYGFAISTTVFSETTVGPDLLGYDASTRRQRPKTSDSVQVLDEAGQEAYGRALFGKPVSGGEDFVQGGCLGEAQRALQEEDPYYEFAEEFADSINDLYASISQDPRLTELEDQAAVCLASAGIDPLAIQDELTVAVRTMVSAHLFDAVQLSSEELSELDVDEFWDATSTAAEHPLFEQLRGELADLQAKEIEAATIAATCADAKVLEQTYIVVSKEYEEKFLAENAERMRYYKAEMERAD